LEPPQPPTWRDYSDIEVPVVDENSDIPFLPPKEIVNFEFKNVLPRAMNKHEQAEFDEIQKVLDEREAKKLAVYKKEASRPRAQAARERILGKYTLTMEKLSTDILKHKFTQEETEAGNKIEQQLRTCLLFTTITGTGSAIMIGKNFLWKVLLVPVCSVITLPFFYYAVMKGSLMELDKLPENSFIKKRAAQFKQELKQVATLNK